MASILAAIAALLLGFAPLSIASSSHNRGSCIDFKVPVAVKANNSIYNIPHVNNNIDAVDLVWNIDTWSSPNASTRVIRPRPVQQTFSISARLCVPAHGTKANILQIATHGLGFDKR